MTAPSWPLAGGWSIWPWLIVRGTGFPVDEVVRLAQPEWIAALDAMEMRESEMIAACGRAAAVLHEATRTPSADGKRLGKAVKRLRLGQLPEPLDGWEPALAEVRAAAAARDRARVELEERFTQARLRSSATLREVASNPRFREAVLWQRPAVVRGAIDALLRQPLGASDRETRKQEQLVARYLQRYCTKNESIGFFGPIGFGTIASGPGAISCTPGPELLDRREVFFEYWAIDALAQTLSAEPGLRPHLRPRRLPTVRVEENIVHYPVARTAELPLEFALALALADGRRTARELAEALLAEGSELDGEEEVFDLLAQLEAKRLLRWTLEVPTHTQHPERSLRTLLDVIPDEPARTRALAALDELLAARAQVAAAAGDAVALDRALGAADETFQRLVPRGTSDEGRTLMTEDCRRDLALELRPRLLEQLGPPLALLLDSARWHTHRMAERYAAALLEVYRRLRAGRASAAIDLLQLWEQAAPLFGEDVYHPAPILLEVRREMQARWAELLGLDPSRRRVECRSADLRAGVATAFGAPSPGWPSARYHSPDLMIAADSLDAIERGEGWFVVGEIHGATNTVSTPLCLALHPSPDQLRQVTERDVPMRIEPVKLRETMHRRCWYSVFPGDVDLETSTARSRRPDDHLLRMGELVAEERDGRLIVRTLDGRATYDVMEFFGFSLSQTIADLHFLPSEGHTPRVSIDRLVVARERWRFSPAELEFSWIESPIERLRQARRWQEKHGIPRFVFVKIPEEIKPCYVDFEAPVFVEALARLSRQASTVTITEMLPEPSQCWLPDAQGRRYACELRFAAVDPLRWQP